MATRWAPYPLLKERWAELWCHHCSLRPKSPPDRVPSLRRAIRSTSTLIFLSLCSGVDFDNDNIHDKYIMHVRPIRVTSNNGKSIYIKKKIIRKNVCTEYPLAPRYLARAVREGLSLKPATRTQAHPPTPGGQPYRILRTNLGRAILTPGSARAPRDHRRPRLPPLSHLWPSQAAPETRPALMSYYYRTACSMTSKLRTE